MQVQSLVGLVPWTLIAQILNLFIQAYLIKRFLFKPINEVLAKRKAMADAEIADAKKDREEAAAMKAEYEKDMAQAREKASDILATAQKTASVQGEQILKDAKAQATAVKIKAVQEIEQEKKKAVTEIRDEIGTIAMDIAGKVIEREINEDDHRKLIDEFIANVGEAS